MKNVDNERIERLLGMIEEEIVDTKISQNAALEVLKRIQINQAKELESIRFNTGWCLYVLIGVLIAVSTGWFWQ